LSPAGAPGTAARPHARRWPVGAASAAVVVASADREDALVVVDHDGGDAD
jgi:hypothetical protein